MPATKSEALKAFRHNVKAEMDRRGLSVRGLAAKAGVSLGGLAGIIRGDEGATLDRAEAIANALGIPLTKLITQNEDAAV